MPDELPVHISREELHSLEVPASFEATGSFDVCLRNHGESLHVHLHLDDPLSEVAAIDAGNHYVEGESERFVRIQVDEQQLTDEPLLGKLKVASGYGATTRWIDVELREPESEPDTVEVGESLAQPQPADPDSDAVIENAAIPVLALAFIALVVAALVVVVIQNVLIIAGAFAVLVGVLVALGFLLRDR